MCASSHVPQSHTNQAPKEKRPAQAGRLFIQS
jgi:hypothetical protein